MKTILRFGYREYLLPDSVNINTLLKSLEKAVELDTRKVGGNYLYVPQKESPELQIHIVDDSKFLDAKKVKQIPETASPDAHNTFGS